MKRAAAAAISLMTGLAMLTGCSRAEVEETIQPLVADAIEESDSEAEAVKEAVSYTHLDVYKRQGRNAAGISLCGCDHSDSIAFAETGAGFYIQRRTSDEFFF